MNLSGDVVAVLFERAEFLAVLVDPGGEDGVNGDAFFGQFLVILAHHPRDDVVNAFAGRLKCRCHQASSLLTSALGTFSVWREGQDLNLRNLFRFFGFRDRRFKPLTHLPVSYTFKAPLRFLRAGSTLLR